MKGLHASALVVPALIVTVVLGGCTTARQPEWTLAGTSWAIKSIDGEAPTQPDKARLVFPDDRKMSASVGCNTIAGGYSIDDDRLMAKGLASTLIGCEGALAQQESALNALLSGAPQISHNGDRLQLDSGGHTLELRRAG